MTMKNVDVSYIFHYFSDFTGYSFHAFLFGFLIFDKKQKGTA